MRSIELCRTNDAGSRVNRCNACGHDVLMNNSCRNRHCPLCQHGKKEEWIHARKREVLPVTYFHVVFTVPDILRLLIWKNKKLLFTLMFDAVKDTLLSVAADEKYFGADIGFFAVLHTWGQQLNAHPHIHCALPGGGFSRKDGVWKHTPYDYLAPIPVLKARYKSFFLSRLKALYRSGDLFLEGTTYHHPAAFKMLIDSLYEKQWVVYLKESFKNSASVIDYLARYTHSVAIANHRIVSTNDGSVSFSFRDYKDHNRKKTIRVEAHEFIRRFLLHTLPKGFVRIRYYGIFSHRKKKVSLSRYRALYGMFDNEKEGPADWRAVLLKKTGVDYSRCPVCENGTLVFLKLVPPPRWGPP